MSKEVEPSMEQDVKRLFAITLPYAFLCSTMSTYFQWRFVGVSAFDFISTSEVITSAVPTLVLTAFFLIPLWVCELFWPREYQSPNDETEQMKYFRFALVCCVVLNGIALGLATSNIYMYPVVYIGLTTALFPVATRLSRAPNIVEHFSSRGPTLALVIVVGCLPSAMLASAAMQVSGIEEGPDAVLIDLSGLEDKNVIQGAQKPFYVGRLGSFLFLRVDGSTVGVPIESFKALKFYHAAQYANAKTGRP
jgi:hypothetical protein